MRDLRPKRSLRGELPTPCLAEGKTEVVWDWDISSQEVATTSVAEWHSKNVITGEERPFSSLASSGNVVLDQNPGKDARGHCRQAHPLMMIINSVVVPTGEVTEHHFLNQQIFCFYNLKCSVLCWSLFLLTQTLW